MRLVYFIFTHTWEILHGISKCCSLSPSVSQDLDSSLHPFYLMLSKFKFSERSCGKLLAQALLSKHYL